MNITTKLVIDMTTGEVLERQSYTYTGPVAECKGGNSRSEMQRADQLQAQEMQLMQQQLAQMNQVLTPFMNANQQLMANTQNAVTLNNQILANGGLTPEQQQAFTAQAVNQATQGYGNAVGQINNALVARGLTGGQYGAGGGGVAQQYGALGAALGGQMQNAIGGIQNMKLQSFENALGMNANLFQGALGNQLQAAGLFSNLTGQFNSGGLGALNAGVTAANNVDQAQNAWTGQMFGMLGSLGGSFLSPFGTQLASKIPCWIARAVYGDEDIRPVFVASRLYRRAETEYPIRLILGLYILLGEPVAWIVNRVPMLKTVFRRLFDRFMKRELEAGGRT